MKDLFQELAYNCLINRLYFIYDPVADYIVINDKDAETVTCGSLEDYPMDELRDMLKAVDEHLEIEHMEDEEFIHERPHGASSDELKMKEAGHKISDFI